MSGSGMNDNAGRLVEDNDMGIFKHHRERDFFRNKFRSGCFGYIDGNAIPRFQLVARFGVSIINPNAAVSE